MIMVSPIDRDADDQCRRIVEMAQDRLQRSDYRGLGMISCHFERGVLFLRGRLLSYYHKQLAHEAVREIVGVGQVVNEIEVAPD